MHAVKEGLRKEKLPQDLILLVEDTGRETVYEMMKLHGYIDVLIPRGGAGLIASDSQALHTPMRCVFAFSIMSVAMFRSAHSST